MESLKNLALNAVPLNASVPAYFKEEVRIARIFKQLIPNGKFVKRCLTDEEVQTMELLKVGFIPFGWGKLLFKLQSCKCCFIGYKRGTLQNIMIKYGICKICNNPLFKSCGVIKSAFSIKENKLIPVDKIDSGLFNYITEKTLFCESTNIMTIESYSNDYPYFCYSYTARNLVDAFPTVKPIVVLRKKDSVKINIGYYLQEFFEINKQWWDHDTTIDKDILFLYQSDIVYYVCTEITGSLDVDLSIKTKNIEKIKQLLSSRSWHINIC
jgi:hypothetical protein